VTGRLLSAASVSFTKRGRGAPEQQKSCEDDEQNGHEKSEEYRIDAEDHE